MKTLYDKIWEMHEIADLEDGTSLIAIDRHLVHEVTSPQAFAGLRQHQRPVRRPAATLAVADHNVPTTDRNRGIQDPASRLQVQTLEENCRAFGVRYINLLDRRQGIVHVVGAEQGFILPGATVVCGDSHTSTHGAFGAWAFGIGTSDVEHVLATQTLVLTKSKTLHIQITGELPIGVGAKDLILTVIARLGCAGATAHVIEYGGDTIARLSMAGRMTVCNMSIEAGARAGLTAPDEVTFAYLEGKPLTPKGEQWRRAVDHWRTLKSDPGAPFDRHLHVDATAIAPTVTWGTNPDTAVAIDTCIPAPQNETAVRMLDYMGLKPGTALEEIEIDRVFIGSCTNARIEDLREAAQIVRGHKISPRLRQAMVVPGSGLVKAQAEAEGLSDIFINAGFEWREAGCSMCLAMNADRLEAGERCASTSNRNFEGRQGQNGRTHLMSPAMAAAAAVHGRLTDVRQMRRNS